MTSEINDCLHYLQLHMELEFFFFIDSCPILLYMNCFCLYPNFSKALTHLLTMLLDYLLRVYKDEEANGKDNAENKISFCASKIGGGKSYHDRGGTVVVGTLLGK